MTFLPRGLQPCERRRAFCWPLSFSSSRLIQQYREKKDTITDTHLYSLFVLLYFHPFLFHFLFVAQSTKRRGKDVQYCRTRCKGATDQRQQSRGASFPSAFPANSGKGKAGAVLQLRADPQKARSHGSHVRYSAANLLHFVFHGRAADYTTRGRARL